MKKNKLLHLKMAPGSTGLMPNLELLDHVPPVRKYVGVKLKKTELSGTERFQFVVKDEGDVVKYHPEYVKAVLQGVLIPCNKETADLCGVAWEEESSSVSKTKKRLA